MLPAADGPVPVCSEGFRRAGAPRPEPRVLGGQAWRMLRDLPAHHRWARRKVSAVRLILPPLPANLSAVFRRDAIHEVLQMLRNSSNPQVENIIRVLKKWAKDNRLPV